MQRPREFQYRVGTGSKQPANLLRELYGVFPVLSRIAGHAKKLQIFALIRAAKADRHDMVDVPFDLAKVNTTVSAPIILQDSNFSYVFPCMFPGGSTARGPSVSVFSQNQINVLREPCLISLSYLLTVSNVGFTPADHDFCAIFRCPPAPPLSVSILILVVPTSGLFLHRLGIGRVPLSRLGPQNFPVSPCPEAINLAGALSYLGRNATGRCTFSARPARNISLAIMPVLAEPSSSEPFKPLRASLCPRDNLISHFAIPCSGVVRTARVLPTLRAVCFCTPVKLIAQ
jgi:hypothetical protein